MDCIIPYMQERTCELAFAIRCVHTGGEVLVELFVNAVAGHVKE